MNRQHVRIAVMVSILLGWCRCALALNPALEVNQYAHTAWRLRDGFFKGLIRSITQTSDGYLWLGTEFGLLRFDGIKAAPWEPSGSQRLPSSDIWSVLAGHDGSLWIGTAKGLARWRGDRLTHYPELSGRFVQRLVEDREGTVWASGIGVPAGILCAVRDAGVTCDGADGTFGYGPFSLYSDRKGNLWVQAPGGLWKWYPEPRTFLSIPGEVGSIQGFEQDSAGRLLFTTHDGIRRIVGTTSEPYSLTATDEPFEPHTLMRDRHGGLWIGTHTEGIVHVRDGRIDRFGPADGLSGASVAQLFEDREGNVWVATTTGLDRFRDFAVSRISARQDLAGSASAVTAAGDGGVWIANSEGVAKWINGRLLTYRAREEQGDRPIARGIRVSGLPRGGVWTVFHDDRRRTWLASPRGFGYLLNNRFVDLPGVGARSVRTIAEDARANVWVADQRLGLIRIAAGGQIERTPWSSLGHTDFATALAADRGQGGLWLGFFNGGVAYFKDGKIQASFGPAEGLSQGWVKALHMGSDAALWVAAETGLSRVQQGHVATLSRANGLPCDSVNWVIADDAGSLWVNMACGLARVTLQDVDAWSSGRIRSIAPTLFDAADGVYSESTPSGATPFVAKATDGRLWFVARDGVNVVDPQRLPFNALPPPVHVEQLVVDQHTYDTRTTRAGPIRLPALIRNLEVHYTALSLVAPERIKFRYKLEGFDRDWQDVGNRRQAFYTNLPPRTYRFRVVAANNSGVWNEAGAAVDFSVAPVYYQTNWFRALSVAMVLAVVWSAHRIRLRIAEKQERELSALNERLMKAQEQERMRIAGELHDSVMQEMLAVTMILGTAKRRIPDGSDAKTKVDTAQEKLINLGAEIRRLSHDLHPPILQQAGLPQAVCAYCEEFSGASGLPVSCEADEGVSQLSRGAALALFRITQEALGNAAKYARATRITVRLARIDGRVSLSVADDGIGFDAGRERAGGLGLIMMRERATQLNGTFDVDTAPGRGTTISVLIPFR